MMISSVFKNFCSHLILRRRPAESLGNLTIELALFVDPSASTIFSQVLSSHQELVDTVLAAINQVQALFRLPSLGQSLQLTIATLEIQLRAPLTLQSFGGQQYKFLESFCQYQESINNPDDNEPGTTPFSIFSTLAAALYFVRPLGFGHLLDRSGFIFRPRRFQHFRLGSYRRNVQRQIFLSAH